MVGCNIRCNQPLDGRPLFNENPPLISAVAGIQWNRNWIYDRKIYNLAADYSVIYEHFGSWDMSEKQFVIIYGPIESRP